MKSALALSEGMSPLNLMLIQSVNGYLQRYVGLGYRVLVMSALTGNVYCWG